MTDSLSELEGEYLDESAFNMAAGESEDFGMFESYETEEELFGETADDFSFKKLFRRIGRGIKKVSPLLKRLAPMAATLIGGPAAGAAVGGLTRLLREDEDLDGGFYEDEDFDPEEFGGLMEDEDLDGEDEAEQIGLDQLSDSLAEELAAAAGYTESEAESAAFAGGVTIQVLGPTPVRVKRMTPVMVKGAVKLTRLLRKNPATRKATPIVATVVKKTARTLVRRAAAGKSITPALTRTAMATHAAKTLASPKAVTKSLTKNVMKRRRLRRIDRKIIARAEV